MHRVTESMKQKEALRTLVLLLFLTLTVTGQAAAIDLQFAGKPGMMMGYINQGVQFGIAGDHYDTMSGFQSAILQSLLETAYYPYPEVKIFASANVNVDWAYSILNGNDRWVERGFDKSKDNLFVLNDYETLLKEAHVTWSPGDFVFRLGKQIVVWGDTDGVRLIDQINPQDTRRGITDVEFETTIIPIWLLRSEYYPHLPFTLLQDLGLEFIFNPNADFIPDKMFSTGNDVSGIWAPNATAGEFFQLPIIGYLPTDVLSLVPPALQPVFDRFPRFQTRVGSLKSNIDKPKGWDSDYFEYGLRLKTLFHDTTITLNGFYGRANSPVTKPRAEMPEVEMASDGVLIVHPGLDGYYPLFKFAGFTLDRDFENLTIDALGGVAPVLRIEALYAFNSTFATSGKVSLIDSLAGKTEEFEKHDEVRYAIGIDWKAKIRWLNPRDSFMISSQFIEQYIPSFPSNYGLSATGGQPVVKHNYTTTLMVRTTYFHNKLVPMVFWQRGYQGSVQGDLLLVQLAYEPNYHWNYTVQAVWLEGEGMEAMDNKDNVSFTIAYRF